MIPRQTSTTALMLPPTLRTSAVANPGRLSLPVLAASLLLALTGCLSRPQLVRESFALTAVASQPSTAASSAAANAILSLKTITVAPLFEGKPFVYRTGEQTWEQDPYAEFLIPPARMLTESVRTSLRRSGIFRDVVEPGALLGADRFAEIHVTELYGDFRPATEPTAFLNLRCTLIRAGTKPEIQLQKEYVRRLPLPARTAPALATAWNDALTQILADLAADLAAQAR